MEYFNKNAPKNIVCDKKKIEIKKKGQTVNLDKTIRNNSSILQTHNEFCRPIMPDTFI